jgi:hypothetical protein
MNRDDAWVFLRAALIALAVVLLATASHADAPKLPAGVTCEQVRANYANFSHLGRGVIRAWLRLNGYSKRDIVEAEKCL